MYIQCWHRSTPTFFELLQRIRVRMLLVVPGHVCHADDPLHDDAADGVVDVQRAVAAWFKKHEQSSLFQMGWTNYCHLGWRTLWF
jgi:hypothetical protein